MEGSEEVLEFLEEHIKPFFRKLLPGAHILFRTQEPANLINYILFFGKLNMPLRATLGIRNDTSSKWLLFQKLGPGKLPKIDPQKTFPNDLPDPSRTKLENEIFSDSIYRYSEPQDVLRPLVKMICPKPKESNILVPFFGLGEVIAACEALNINSVGFDYQEDFDPDEQDFQYEYNVITALAEMPIE